MPNSILDSLTCQICLTMMEDPRTLPCGHVFCLRCIKTLRNFQRGNDSDAVTLQCPSRCARTKLTREGVNSFPKNFTLNSIIESINQTGVCKTHNDIMGFIDIANGELSCASCVATKILSDSHRSHPVDTPSSLEPELDKRVSDLQMSSIQNFAVAEDTLKSSLTELTTRANAMISRLEAGIKICRQHMNANTDEKKAAEKTIDATFDYLQNVLDNQRKKILSDLAKDLPESTTAHVFDSRFSDIAQCLQSAVKDATALLDNQNISAHRPSIVPFLRFGVNLQMLFTNQLNIACSVIDIAQSESLQWRNHQISIETQNHDVLEKMSFCTFNITSECVEIDF